MARIKLHDQDTVTDEQILGIFEWVTEMEGKVPNHFLLELNFPEFMKAKLGATKVLWEMGELGKEQIQHVGILVSRANGCPYCTGAFCTILSHGLNASKQYVDGLVDNGVAAVEEAELRLLLDFALKVNDDPKSVTDADVTALREAGYTDKGILQIVHLVSDFASYNKLNLAMSTDYDYEQFGTQG
ncbi:MAG: carboxymuconolactone decarboxylase family protein [Pseudomonadota bacterium]